MYEYRAAYIGNYDGDTVDFDIDCGFGIKYRIRTRLLNVDTYEMRGTEGEDKEKAVAAKKLVEEVLTKAEEIIVRTSKDKKGKYGRYLAEILYCPDKTQINEEAESGFINLNNELIEKDLVTGIDRS